jgi:hypothetical protein
MQHCSDDNDRIPLCCGTLREALEANSRDAEEKMIVQGHEMVTASTAGSSRIMLVDFEANELVDNNAKKIVQTMMRLKVQA